MTYSRRETCGTRQPMTSRTVPPRHPLLPTSNCYKPAIVRACTDRLREIESLLEQIIWPCFEQQKVYPEFSSVLR